MIYHVENVHINEENFWNAIHVFLNKPHVINKRLWGVKIISKFDMSFKCKDYDNIKFSNEYKKFADINELYDEMQMMALLKQLHPEKCNCEIESNVDIILLELLPKTYSDPRAYNLICLNKREVKAIFFDVTSDKLKQKLCPNFPYSFHIQNRKLTLAASCESNEQSYQWLVASVVPQLIKWASENINNPMKSLCSESLSLVSYDKYYTKYNELKIKYGKEMVKIWPECTDPAKFVYEDIAIATYLLLLWEEERLRIESKELQSFVDLGCGNGLLVFILTSEGHPGTGIDVRKRNIWNIYPNNIKLLEKTITPSDSNLFPDTDWVIGNHSDELTPWIPVVAMKSSYKCRFFLLPCCAYNFDGSKYQRKDSSKSQYMEYMEYINNLCVQCGFDTKIDRLKIPSTKRICLIGRQRNYTEEGYSANCDKIKLIISSASSTKIPDSSNWISDFKARECIERVRNCTQIERSTIESIVCCITTHLLENCASEAEWSPGKTVDIHELVELIPADILKKLKSECGGLQTLLKNNSHIFSVRNGKVCLKYPKTINEVKNNASKDKKRKPVSVTNIKKRQCWFFNNHPQGCPLTNDNCSFVHTKA